MGSGSTIIARQSSSIYFPILIALCVAAVVFLIFLITKKISSYKKTAKYLEKIKSRPTTLKDLKRFKYNYNLTSDESMLLWEMCNAAHPHNINYLIFDNPSFEDFFRTIYDYFKNKHVSDKKFASFFALRYKLEKAIARTKKLSSTHNIPANSILFLIDQTGEQFPTTVLKNEKQYVTLEIPGLLVDPRLKPQELQRARFMYKTMDGMTYLFLARPIRYTQENGTNVMIISHSNDLVLQTQRQTKREFVNQACQFVAVKMNPETQKFSYADNLYPAKIVNVSAGGCCIHTKLPIKEKQLISVIYPDLDLDKNTIGKILHTGFIPGNNTYALHIQFIKINTSVQNRIYAYVYKFEL